MQQFHGALARSPVAEVAVGEDGFGELAADGVERVQRGLGVLEYHADVAATDAAKLLVRQVVDAAAVEADLAAGNAAGGVQESDHSRAEIGRAAGGERGGPSVSISGVAAP